MSNALLDERHPARVTSPTGQVDLIVINAGDRHSTAFELVATTAADKVIVRIGGGCKNMSAADKERMLEYFAAAFRGYRGAITSGATRARDGERIDPMVTDIPGVIASLNPGVVALGTLPRTDRLRLTGDHSQLVLDDWGQLVNPAMQAALIVQQNSDDAMGWDGDLDYAFGMTDRLLKRGGFRQAGWVLWNGGDVTRDEAMWSLRVGYPTMFVRGSGRAADDLIKDYEAGKLRLPPGAKFLIAEIDDPMTLRGHLIDSDLIAA